MVPVTAKMWLWPRGNDLGEDGNLTPELVTWTQHGLALVTTATTANEDAADARGCRRFSGRWSTPCTSGRAVDALWPDRFVVPVVMPSADLAVLIRVEVSLRAEWIHRES